MPKLSPGFYRLTYIFLPRFRFEHRKHIIHSNCDRCIMLLLRLLSLNDVIIIYLTYNRCCFCVLQITVIITTATATITTRTRSAATRRAAAPAWQPDRRWRPRGPTRRPAPAPRRRWAARHRRARPTTRAR